uniref:Pejvakin-like n=1 Tax=Saccoglossus kowalevskii TaxID=10224 RepID=A0ABM0MVU8_SACKO|nr:PREDICTED: pejvakin-like [Saccoglossus kowalevskii]
MFKSLTDKLSKSLGEDTLLPVPSLDQADNCRPLSIVVKKNRRWFWRAPKYLPSQYTLSQLLSNKEDLDVPIINEDLTNFDDVSSFSVKGKIGAKIASEVDLDVKASDDIQMSSKLGQIVKNKVNIPILQDLLTRKKLNLTHPFIEEIRQNYRNVLCVVVGSLCTTKDCQLVAKLLREKEQGADVGSQGPIQGEEDVSVVDDQTRVIRIPADKPVSYHVCELHITTEGGIRLLILGEGTGGFDKPDEEKFVDIDVGEDEPDNPFIDRTESTNPFDDPEPNHYEPFKSIVSLEFARQILVNPLVT